MQKYTNRLVDEKSPYLLQHAANPVDWFPWGEEPFARARTEDKPVFLSIGYSTCHWCHVMAHESFESDEVAALLNKWFVSIKVDREERPDIDQMYMAATQAMTGSGGWPMSVFLLPDGTPFYAGTYFPPHSSSQRPGFVDLLSAVHRAWQEQRDELQQTAQRLIAGIAPARGTADSSINPDADLQCFRLLEQDYDTDLGGFGQAPKFPRPSVFSFLFHYSHASGTQKARDMALHTLEKMAAGGMYDHLGGGFHRYSVDAQWFVPHFEKMLYDQSQLANAYLDAFLITGEMCYARVAREIFDYVIRDMRNSSGAFYSAEDADSDDPYEPGHHGEGAFYLWRDEEIADLLGSNAELFAFSYGVEPGGNVEQDPLHEFTGRNILHRAHTDEEAAARFEMDIGEVRRRLAEAVDKLWEARSARKRPHLDDKIITAWNGLLIGALARGGRVLDDPGLLGAARRAAAFIKEVLFDDQSRTLHRRYRDGQAGCAGQLDDYAYLVDGLCELYQAIQEPQWLAWAIELSEKQIELFWNEQGRYFYDSVADSSVKLRMRGMYDGAEPTGNSVAAGNLHRLGILQDRQQWLEMAGCLFDSFGEIINHYPPALPLMLTVRLRMKAHSLQVVIAGDREAEDTRALWRVVAQRFAPGLNLLLADGGANQAFLSKKLPFLESLSRKEGRATAYVCTDFTCRQALSGAAELETLLAESDGV